MPASAYQGVITKSYVGRTVARPLDSDESSGAQRGASNSVVGSDAAVTATLVAQPIGAASVVAGYVLYVPPIPS